MYVAKSEGKNRFCHYFSEMETQAKNQLILEGDLRKALEQNEFEVYYQPKLALGSESIIGFEALVRWNHPIKGLIKPNSFIGMAEDNGLIGDLTDLVFNKALDYSGQLKQMGHDLNVAINISVDTLTDLEWPDHIAARLEDSGLDASSISFEITETRLMEHLSVALDILSRSWIPPQAL